MNEILEKAKTDVLAAESWESAEEVLKEAREKLQFRQKVELVAMETSLISWYNEMKRPTTNYQEYLIGKNLAK